MSLLNQKLQPQLDSAEAGQRKVYFVDTVHLLTQVADGSPNHLGVQRCAEPMWSSARQAWVEAHGCLAQEDLCAIAGQIAAGMQQAHQHNARQRPQWAVWRLCRFAFRPGWLPQ